MTKDEIEIVKQAKSGSREAFNKIYNTHVIAVKNTIRQFYKQPDIISDLTNITFLKAYKKLNTFVTNESLRSWLQKIANNTCIDYTRKQNRSTAVSLDDENNAFLQLSCSVPNAEENIVKREEVRSLLKHLKSLSEKQQKVIDLFYFQDKKYREIAEMLNLPLGTVQSELNRAKRKLKTFIYKTI